MLKIDLHIHSKEDPQDRILHTAKELIDKAVKLKFDVLSITLHNHLLEDKEITAYAKKKGILLISGAEIKIERKEILVYNIKSKYLKNIKTFEDLKKLKRKFKNMFIIAPHPFFKTGECLGKHLKEHIELFDAIEYSWFFTKIINFNKKAIKIAEKYNKPIIATSDAHHLKNFGNNYSLLNSKKDIKSIFSAIRRNKIKTKSDALPLLFFISSSFKMVFGMILSKLAKITKSNKYR